MKSHRRFWNPMEGSGIPWKVLESHGRFWNLMEGSGIPWKALEHGGIFCLLTNDYK
jgi:hypothetical protein